MTNGSTKAVVMLSASSNHASTWNGITADHEQGCCALYSLSTVCGPLTNEMKAAASRICGSKSLNCSRNNLIRDFSERESGSVGRYVVQGRENKGT